MKPLASVLLLFACTCLLSVRNLSAQVYAEQVWDQLQSHYSHIVENYEGYDLKNFVFGKMNEDANDSWTFTLSYTTDYIITGACDHDCSDLDICILDASGNKLECDELEDDTPWIIFSPSSNGRFTIQVNMYECDEEPCYFGFGIYEK